jgi:hypothetical protein
VADSQQLDRAPLRRRAYRLQAGEAREVGDQRPPAGAQLVEREEVLERRDALQQSGQCEVGG